MAILQGFAKHRGERRRKRGRAAPGRGGKSCVGQPPIPQVYIGEREGAAPPLGFPPQGVRQPQTHLGWRPRGGGREGNLPPKQGGAPPSPNPRHLGPLWGGAPAHLGLVPSHTWPTQPSGAGGPTWWTPGTLPVVPVRYRKNPKLFWCPKQDFPYINLYLRTIPELLVTSGISSGTPNNIR